MTYSTHRQRILDAMRGKMVDVIPFVPRLDLWWIANSMAGTLPSGYEDKKPDDIARAEGWACYHMVPDFTNMIKSPDDMLHQSIGLFNFIQSVYGWRFSEDMEVIVGEKDGQQIIEYKTPVGTVRTVGGLTEDMKRKGASLGWTQERIIKTDADYDVVGWIFENLEVFPQYDGATEYRDEVGEDGVVAAGGASLAASPMHHIQKEFIDSTRFYFEYEDNYPLMQRLAERVGVYYDKVMKIIGDSPYEVVLWGANYDEMLTYPPYFAKEIAPWIKKVSDYLGERGKIVSTHTDGENQGLMDQIRDCGAHVAESVTPYPMTKVTIEEYYRRWRDSLTIMGGIPESILSPATATEEEFEAFMDNLFASVAPGDRLILGTADSTPPGASFDRLRRIGERTLTEGRLPLTAGDARPVSKSELQRAAARVSPEKTIDRRLLPVKEAIMDGDEDALTSVVAELLGEGYAARDILNDGMIGAMEVIGARFRTGELFIPDVLLAARAMNEGLRVLEPHLAEGKGAAEEVRVLIGTVQGDMHDIGKNMVAIMLKGVGCEVKDIGINVTTDEFIRQTEEFNPHILGMSALLTTTMDQMKLVIDSLTERGIRDGVKVIVGGAPVNKKFAADIGADGYAADAGEAVSLVQGLVG